MTSQANPESVLNLEEAVAAVRIVALAFRCPEVITETEIKVAGRILQEAHFTLDEKLCNEEGLVD